MNGNATTKASQFDGHFPSQGRPIVSGEARIVSNRMRFTAAHVAWTAMFCSILLWGFGGVRAGALGDTGNWYRITLVLFAGLAGIYALLRNVGRLARGFHGPVLLLLIYGLFAMISSVYIPEFALYSMWKALEVVIDVIIIAAVLSYSTPMASAQLAYRIFLLLYGMLLLTYSVEAFVVPSSALLPSRGLIPFTMQGVLPIMNGNGFAFLSAVLAFAAWCRMLTSRNSLRRLLWLGVFVWATITLILAQSRTSLLGLAAAICVFLLVNRRFGLLALILVGATLAVALTPFVDVAEHYVVRGQSEELFTTLSGRTYAWQAAWKLFQQSPLVGHGFAAAARAQILGATSAAASTLHGAIFDVMVGVGLLGLIPWVVAILWTMVLMFVAARRRQSPMRNAGVQRSWTAEMTGVLALILIRSSTNSGLAMHEHEFMLFLTVVAYAIAVSGAAFRGTTAAARSPQSPGLVGATAQTSPPR